MAPYIYRSYPRRARRSYGRSDRARRRAARGAAVEDRVGCFLGEHHRRRRRLPGDECVSACECVLTQPQRQTASRAK